MTLTIMLVAWLMMGLIFCLGYIMAMQNTIHKIQEKVFPETRKQIDIAKTEKDNDIIVGRIQVSEELVDILRPPWMKKQ